MLHVCLAVSGKELTSLDAEEIEGKSAKALKQLGLKELEAKRSRCFKVWLIISRCQGGLKGFAFILRHNVMWVNDSISIQYVESVELGMIYFTTLRRCFGTMNVSDHLLNDV